MHRSRFDLAALIYQFTYIAGFASNPLNHKLIFFHNSRLLGTIAIARVKLTSNLTLMLI